MKNYTWLLDAGHGGITGGLNYTTAPGKMWKFASGKVIYEGVINREIASLICLALNDYGVNYRLIYDYSVDTSLVERAKEANILHAHFGNCVGLSIHSNSSAVPGAGKGFEVFTSIGETPSDIFAKVIHRKITAFLPEFAFREDYADGDPDKESKLYILRKTNCPFVLVENLFFDREEEADFLLTARGRERIAFALVEAIIEVEKSKLI